ncbi:MAG: hypothetical protein HY820_41720 [Acidobacteria bacterium]|nr:hypothetical protein [Acidobacteriota bacterium]
MRQVEREEQDRLLALLEQHERRLLALPGVYYADAGYRIRENRHADELTLRVFVHKKLPLADLAANDVAPRDIAGVGVDVIESRRVPHEPAHRERLDPLPGGMECGNRRFPGREGTLGLIVRQVDTGELLGLSNYHLWVRGGGQAGDQICQPHTNLEADVIGTLLDWSSDLDCAVARLNHSRGFSLRTALGLPSLRSIAQPLIGMSVTKSGLVTGVTAAQIDGVGLPGQDVTMVPDPANPPKQNEITIEGDSGSVWIQTSTRDAIGLHHSGEAPGKPDRAWAKRMTDVAKAMRFTL